MIRDSFVIPMKKLGLKCFKELMEIDKDNRYLKAGKRNKYVYLIKSYSDIYYLKMPLDNGDILNVNLGGNYRKAINKSAKILEFYKKKDSIYKVYDCINIIFKKEG
ncbi:hypothetical protein H9660_08745 [Clostridium sp. Sa3CUN1]|uniref:Uncharacterized protein n=1 Tax=Clostridium gallinarum TaxID=2762246 RepID=A0ABR8Q498_9CLOT|nr:hypothetical protein [Clostridium gallinarum]MBD7915233.1 hypothetical protein [Clostridium gallinarum]